MLRSPSPPLDRRSVTPRAEPEPADGRPDRRTIEPVNGDLRRHAVLRTVLRLVVVSAFAGAAWAASQTLLGGADESLRPAKLGPGKGLSRDSGAVRSTMTPSEVVASRPKGMSLVARAVSRRIVLYRSPQATRSRRVLRNPNMMKVRTVFAVRAASGTRYKVALPVRPNGSTAWVRAVDVRVVLVRHRVDVDLRRHRITVWRGNQIVERDPIGVGRAVTPTPTGAYYITALLKQHDPDGLYGPYAFALSGHSPVLNEFAGGNGRIGIHGTNQPSAIGSDVSHGCIRVSNATIRRLARMLALGTPVRISHS